MKCFKQGDLFCRHGYVLFSLESWTGVTFQNNGLDLSCVLYIKKTDHYRGISLLSVTGKLFTKLINNE